VRKVLRAAEGDEELRGLGRAVRELVELGGQGDLEGLCKGLRGRGYGAPRVERSRRVADALRSPRHAFIVVEVPGRPRVVVDPAFTAQLRVARPSPSYRELMGALPDLFVGPAPALEQLVQLCANRLEESFRELEMPCPPWRDAVTLANTWAL